MPRLAIVALVLGVVFSCFRGTQASSVYLTPLQGRRHLTNSAGSDQLVLCDFWDSIPVTTNKAKLTNWCGAGDASSVCGGASTSSWLGVECAVVGGVSRATKLDTYGVRGIGGSLPTSIGGLDALTLLHLGEAGLTGSIPSSLGGLTGLTYLGLGTNSLTGSIPSSLGGLTGLNHLYLDHNSLSGSIPSTLGGLTALTFLYLGANSFSGSIPTSLGALTRLLGLWLTSSALSGSIPSSLGALTGLNYIYLADNALTGPVPASFCSLQPSIQLYVTENPGLTCYPSCLATYSTFMTYGKGSTWQCTAAPTPRPTSAPLETSDGDILCDLYSTMPTTGKASLTNWCGAKSGGNFVSGPCTGTGAWYGVTCTAGRVTSLRLSSTKTGGSIPSSLRGLTGLTELDLSSNSLSGRIPSALGTLTGLTVLWLHDNALTGAVPASFCSLQPSIQLYVNDNPGLTCYASCNPSLTSYSFFRKDASLTGMCPTPETSDADILCDFYNTMPATGNKAKLTNWCGAKSGNPAAYVNGPCTGTAGAWLGVTCGTVLGASRVTKLDTCQFTGSACSVRSLGGSLPTSIGGLDALTYLELYLAGISGSIPSALGGLTGLTHISLASNSLTGPVPTSFCSLKKSSSLKVQSNLGLTCYPSCLSTYSAFNKDPSLGVCATGVCVCASLLTL